MSNKKVISDVEIGREYRKFISTGLLALYSYNAHKGASRVTYNKDVQSNIFLGKWLIKVLKNKQYIKELAGIISSMIALYKSKGAQADLIGNFERHYSEIKTTSISHVKYTGSEQTRLELAAAQLRIVDWEVNLSMNYDPHKMEPYEPLTEKEVFSLDEDFTKSFGDDVSMKIPLRMYATEKLQELVDAFYGNGFYIVVLNKSQSDDRFSVPRWCYSLDIYPHDKPVNGIEVPTIYKY